MTEKTTEAVAAALAALFDPSEVKSKPAVVSGNRAMALHYIDARVVMDRLDEVVGSENWQDAYEFLPDGSCTCKLSVRIGGEWLTKMDVGGPSEQPDEGDQRKSAVSDALKRAAVKFGVGRYLYRLPRSWCDYDPQKKQFTRPPQLPEWAIPGGKVPAARVAPTKPAAPKDGKEFLAWLKDFDAAGAGKGRWKKDELTEHVYAYALAAGNSKDMVLWDAEAVASAGKEVRAFAEKHPEAKKAG